MSMGDTYNNNKDKQDYRPTVYSMNTFSNIESEIEKSKLSYTFWKGMLKVSIAPMIEAKDDSVKFNYDDESAIYLSPQLSYQLYEQIKLYMADPDAYESKGIKTKSLGVIKIVKGSKYGTKGHILLIEKLDENRTVVGGHLYQFNNEKYYGIDNFDEDEFTFEKTYYNNLEIDFLLLTLKKFYESSVGAQAYFNIDYGRFDYNRMMGKLTGIGEAVGVQSKKSYNKGYGGNKNDPFENKGNNSTNDSYSYDDIDDQFE